jgi:hypothetical protein
MESEEVLDHSTRAAILSQLVAKKPAAAPSLSTSDKVKAVCQIERPTTKVGGVICKHCSHKMWHDGEDWQHSGKEHDANCECRNPELGDSSDITPALSQAKKSNGKFDSTTPAADLLEAVMQNKVGEMKKEEQEAAILDKNRQVIIEKINERSGNILKGWRF